MFVTSAGKLRQDIQRPSGQIVVTQPQIGLEQYILKSAVRFIRTCPLLLNEINRLSLHRGGRLGYDLPGLLGLHVGHPRLLT